MSMARRSPGRHFRTVARSPLCSAGKPLRPVCSAGKPLRLLRSTGKPLRLLVMGSVVMLVLVLTGGTAFAGKIDDLIKQLGSEDFRVRTQAALALGATYDNAAVKPLCGKTGDS